MRRLVICVLALQVVHILGLPSLQRLEKRAFQRGHPSFDMEPEELCKMCMEVLEEQSPGLSAQQRAEDCNDDLNAWYNVDTFRCQDYPALFPQGAVSPSTKILEVLRKFGIQARKWLPQDFPPIGGNMNNFVKEAPGRLGKIGMGVATAAAKAGASSGIMGAAGGVRQGGMGPLRVLSST